MKHIYTLFVALSILTACDSSQKKERLTIYMDNEVLNNSKTIGIDSIRLPQEFIYAQSFFVYKDSILIVQNKKAENVYFLEFYNLYSQEKVTELFRYGNGPQEMLAAKINISNDLLIVDDYVKKEVAFIPIDSVLKNKRYIPEIQEYYVDARSVVPHFDEKILVDNPNYFSDPNLKIETENEPRFLLYTSKEFQNLQIKQGKYYTRNVSAGTIIPNYDHDRILYFNYHLSEIEVYNTQLTLKKHLLGPNQLDANYTVIDNELIFKKVIPYSYWQYCCDKNYIYIIYVGELWNVETVNFQQLHEHILKFDWDGNLIQTYKVPCFINNISMGKENEYLYATGYNEEENPILLQLSLK